MKKLLILGFILLIQEVNAQKISIKRDVVYSDKEPICNIVSLGTLTNQAYAVKNLENVELILIDQSQLHNAEGNSLLRFMFSDLPKSEAFMPVTFGFKKQLARLIVIYHLVENGKLNPQGVARFCKNYNGYLKSNRLGVEPTNNTIAKETDEQQANDTAHDDNQEQEVVQQTIKNTPEIAPSRDAEYEYPLVERDVEQTVFLSGSTIRQDFKEIGSYSVVSSSDNQDDYKVIISDINGVRIAEATIANNEGECDLLTIKDQKKRRVTIPKSDQYSIVKDIVMKLSFLMYL